MKHHRHPLEPWSETSPHLIPGTKMPWCQRSALHRPLPRTLATRTMRGGNLVGTVSRHFLNQDYFGRFYVLKWWHCNTSNLISFANWFHVKLFKIKVSSDVQIVKDEPVKTCQIPTIKLKGKHQVRIVHIQSYSCIYIYIYLSDFNEIATLYPTLFFFSDIHLYSKLKLPKFCIQTQVSNGSHGEQIQRMFPSPFSHPKMSRKLSGCHPLAAPWLSTSLSVTLKSSKWRLEIQWTVYRP